MANLPGADPYGPYWAEHAGSRRDNCYSIVPVKDGTPERVTDQTWKELFNTLGELGYLFQDAGHNTEHLAISLDKVISEEHIKKLQDQLKITSIPSNHSDFASA